MLLVAATFLCEALTAAFAQRDRSLDVRYQILGNPFLSGLLSHPLLCLFSWSIILHFPILKPVLLSSLLSRSTPGQENKQRPLSGVDHSRIEKVSSKGP